MEDQMHKILTELSALRHDVRGIAERQSHVTAILDERCKGHDQSLARHGESVKDLYGKTNELQSAATARLEKLNNSINRQEVLGEAVEKLETRITRLEQKVVFYVGCSAGLAWFLTSGLTIVQKMLQ